LRDLRGAGRDPLGEALPGEVDLDIRSVQTSHSTYVPGVLLEEERGPAGNLARGIRP
jgi:hypothetical protein